MVFGQKMVSFGKILVGMVGGGARDKNLTVNHEKISRSYIFYFGTFFVCFSVAVDRGCLILAR